MRQGDIRKIMTCDCIWRLPPKRWSRGLWKRFDHDVKEERVTKTAPAVPKSLTNDRSYLVTRKCVYVDPRGALVIGPLCCQLFIRTLQAIHVKGTRWVYSSYLSYRYLLIPKMKTMCTGDYCDAQGAIFFFFSFFFLLFFFTSFKSRHCPQLQCNYYSSILGSPHQFEIIYSSHCLNIFIAPLFQKKQEQSKCDIGSFCN